MPERSYKVYPSGFLGSDKVKTTKPVDFEKIKEQIFNLSNISNPDGHTANLRIVSMWDTTLAGGEAVRSFEFKEEVLRCAVNAFGTQNWFDWVKAQKASPYHNEWHYKWIEETVEFVVLDKPRKLSTYNWTFLLNSAPQPHLQYKCKSTEEAMRNLGDNLSLQQWVTMWVSRQGGIEDLAASLYVLFGSRD